MENYVSLRLFLLAAIVVGIDASFVIFPSAGKIPSSLSGAGLVQQPRHRSSKLSARQYYDEDDEEDYDDDDDFYFEDESANRSNNRRRRRRRGNFESEDDLGGPRSGGFGRPSEGLEIPSPFGLRSGLRLPESLSKALLAGIFILGVGTGVTVDSQINTNPKDLASRDAIDQAAPNRSICTSFGASAMAFDQRVFVSFNPFNVYVAQADVKPACVLRSNNVVPILRDKYSLINDGEVRSCKANSNTWAFVGDLDSLPQLSCVYQSEDAQNEFLSNPKLGIGEDVYDDDRAAAMAATVANKAMKKSVKDGAARKAAMDDASRMSFGDLAF